MPFLTRFLADERGFCAPEITRRTGKWLVALIVLNQIRGVIVAGTLAVQIFS
jgi:hypothetical protein